MTVKELIKDKNYPLITFRVTCPWSEVGEFFGTCKCINGHLIALDGDNYDENEIVVKYEEYYSESYGLCLDITVEGVWEDG